MNHTRLIFFAGKNKEIRNKILDIANTLFATEHLNVHKTLENFLTDLQTPDCNHKIILILVNTHEDLLRMLLIKESFNDHKIILILPDTTQRTMTQALKLYPRYISHIQETYEDVMSVLKKMRNNFTLNNNF